MTLLAFVETARRDGDFQPLLGAIPYASFLGVTAARRDGRLVASLPFRPDLVGNPAIPAIHGGVIGAFLETAAVLSLFEQVPGAHLPKTITLTIDYLRTARAETLHASGRVLRSGTRVANVLVDAWQQTPERPVAAAKVNLLIVGNGDGR